MLHILGLSPPEQGLYETLLPRPPVTHAELVDLAADWTDHIGPTVDRLQHLDLLTVVGTDPPRYVVTPPQTALGSLLGGRDRELMHAHQRMLALSTRFHEVHGVPGPAERVEVVRGPELIERHLTDIIRSARHHLRMCDAPPYAALNQLVQNRTVGEALNRGVCCQVLYDRAALDHPGRVASIARCIEAGEQARVTEAPMKMVLSDRPLGMLQLDVDVAPSEQVLIVRDPALLTALTTLFDLYWERAVPLHIGHAGAATSPPVQISDDDGNLLSLLVSGLTDRAVADHLGWSERTVRRRVSDLMSRLDARTRFQAGYQAVALGWLTADEEGRRVGL